MRSRPGPPPPSGGSAPPARDRGRRAWGSRRGSIPAGSATPCGRAEDLAPAQAHPVAPEGGEDRVGVIVLGADLVHVVDDVEAGAGVGLETGLCEGPLGELVALAREGRDIVREIDACALPPRRREQLALGRPRRTRGRRRARAATRRGRPGTRAGTACAGPRRGGHGAAGRRGRRPARPVVGGERAPQGRMVVDPQVAPEPDESGHRPGVRRARGSRVLARGSVRLSPSGVEMFEPSPLFPLGLVLFPQEPVPLHIFEERYKTMIGECLEGETEFGVIWLSDDGLREVGCAASIASGPRPLRRWPHGHRRPRAPGPSAARAAGGPGLSGRRRRTARGRGGGGGARGGAGSQARERYADLVDRATDSGPSRRTSRSSTPTGWRRPSTWRRSEAGAARGAIRARAARARQRRCSRRRSRSSTSSERAQRAWRRPTASCAEVPCALGSAERRPWPEARRAAARDAGPAAAAARARRQRDGAVLGARGVAGRARARRGARRTAARRPWSARSRSISRASISWPRCRCPSRGPPLQVAWPSDRTTMRWSRLAAPPLHLDRRSGPPGEPPQPASAQRAQERDRRPHTWIRPRAGGGAARKRGVDMTPASGGRRAVTGAIVSTDARARPDRRRRRAPARVSRSSPSELRERLAARPRPATAWPRAPGRGCSRSGSSSAASAAEAGERGAAAAVDRSATRAATGPSRASRARRCARMAARS